MQADFGQHYAYVTQNFAFKKREEKRLLAAAQGENWSVRIDSKKV